jgi:uncharacterized protein
LLQRPLPPWAEMPPRSPTSRSPVRARRHHAEGKPWLDAAEPLAELEALYREADALYSGHLCPACTRCCRPRLSGREPYVTSIELLAVAREWARRGASGRRAPARARDRQPKPRADGVCPLLTVEGRCGVYPARPLGCRTFWCRRAHAEPAVPHRRLLALVRRVQEIAARHQPGGDQGRPFLRALAELDRPARAASARRKGQ